MKKLLIVAALSALCLLPNKAHAMYAGGAGASAGASVTIMAAFGVVAVLPALVLTGVDPWTPLFGKEAIEYSYPK